MSNNNDDQNKIFVNTNTSSAKLNISVNNTKQAISATNNKAQYYADLAKKYMEESQKYSDSSKYYSEQNSNITVEYVQNLKNDLENQISTKQQIGDYAFHSEVPKLTSELENDLGYITENDVLALIPDSEIPDVEGNAGKVLTTDGSTISWKEVNSFQLFDMVLKDHILSYEESKGFALQGSYVYKNSLAGTRYGYPDFYSKCVEEKENGVPTQTTLADTTVLTYVNSNGHVFYDIEDKAAVDVWFDTYGIADMYGVDVENERILLPRNNNFIQLTTDEALVNQFNEAGLPDHNHTLTLIENAGSRWGTSQPAWGNDDQFRTTTATATVANASETNSIYGKSNTVQPMSSNKLLYYVVGNVTASSGLVELVNDEVDILTQFNEGLDTAMSAKVNVDGSNAEFVRVVSTYSNGTSWYRVYSDGWCEQGGYVSNVNFTSSGTRTITFLLPFTDTNYLFLRNCHKNGISNDSGSRWVTGYNVKSTDSITYFTDQVGYIYGDDWCASGFLAQGAY